jgi:FtsZ-interacting cell division protein ZipA
MGQMDQSTVVAIVIAVVVVLAVLALAIWLTERKRTSQRLKRQFGPEYERVLQQHGDSRRAEEILAEREKRVEKFTIRHLPTADRDRYAQEWAAVQRRFVDDPAMAVMEADSLVTALMSAREYPMADFEQRTADISVNYPRVVQNYRAARLIVVRHGKGQATTEELRQAMVYYRSLFEELLEAPMAERMGVTHERRIAS